MNGGGRPASPLSCILQKFVSCYKNAQVLLLDQKYIGNIEKNINFEQIFTNIKSGYTLFMYYYILQFYKRI